MIFVLGFAVCILLIILFRIMVVMVSFDQNVKRLFASSDSISEKKFHTDAIKTLPEPVQQYFRHVLTEGQPYISQARLKHRGRFKTGISAAWTPINGEEYFTANKPGFIWRGKTNKFTAIDQYTNGEGSLKVFLYSFLRIVNGRGPGFTQGELLRWLGECVWFPTALLPNDYLRWEAVDSHAAKLVFHYKKISVFYIVRFNAVFEIEELETRRCMDGNKLEAWVGKLSNYRKANNVLIPATIQATWKLDSRDFTYAVFYLTAIEYDKPQKFKTK